MSNVTGGVRRGVWLACVLGGLLLAPAAHAATITVKANPGFKSAGKGEDELPDLPGSDPVSVAVYVNSDTECDTIQLAAVGAGNGAASKKNATTANFDITYSRPPKLVSEDHVITVTCIFFGFPIATGETTVPIDRIKPPRDAPKPQKAPPAAPTKRGKAGKNGGASKKGGGPKRVLGVRYPLDLGADSAGIFAAFAAREAEASVPLDELLTLPDPAGAFADAVVVAAAKPMPALPAFLTPAARADVEAALRNLSDQIVLGEAAIEALARREAAYDAGDAAAAAKQEAAAADLLDRWAGALGASAALQAAAQASLVAAGAAIGPVTLTADEVEAMHVEARNGTLPAGMSAVLAADGASPRALRAAANAILVTDTAELTAFTPTLDDPGLGSDEAKAATELRELALALRKPGAETAPITEPTPGSKDPRTGLGALKPVACAAADVPRCAKAAPMISTAYVAVSPDARFVYVSSRGATGGVAGFARDPLTGKLTPLKGKGGCAIGGAAADGCLGVKGLTGASGLVVPSDGRDLYVAAPLARRIVQFRRAVKTGLLRYAGCVTDAQSTALAPECTVVPGYVSDAKTLTISPDGRHLYSGQYSWSVLQTLARDRRTGRLTGAGCVGRRPECVQNQHVSGARGTDITQDGRFVVLADQSTNAAIAFARNPSTGALTETGCVAGDGGGSVVAGCVTGVGISGPENITVSPRQGEIVVSSSSSGSLVRITLDPASGLLQLGGADSPCVTDGAGQGNRFCLGQPGLGSTYGVAVSPDAGYVYAASYNPGSVTAFRRDPKSGELVLLGKCYSVSVAGCVKRAGMQRAGAVQLTPDARHLIVAAPDSNAVQVFARRLQAARVAIRGGRVTARRGRVVLRLTCPKKAVAWCAGTVRVRHGAATSRPVSFLLRPGKPTLVRVEVPAGLRGASVATATTVEPWGKTARATRRLTIAG